MPQFGTMNLYKDAALASINPVVGDDTLAGFSVGSMWFNTTTGMAWLCIDATAGAAQWVPLMGGETMLGHIKAANMNSTADQAFTMNVPATAIKFGISKILVTNPSISLTTAAGGVYDTASKGGNAIVANTQVYTALTAATKLLALTIAAAGSGNTFSVAPILSLTTAQGAAATADFYLFGEILPTFAS